MIIAYTSRGSYAIQIAMAEARAEACAQPVLVASNRRQFSCALSSHVLPTLIEIIRRIDPAALSAILDPQSPAFVCRGCFSSLEKLKKSVQKHAKLAADISLCVRSHHRFLANK